MKHERNTSAMIEAALIALVVSVVVFMIRYLPVVGYFTVFVPAMFAVVWVRRGRHYGVLSVIVSSVITFIMGIPAESLMILVYGGFVSACLGEGVGQKLKTSQTILVGSVGATLSVVVLFGLTELFTGIGLMQLLTEAIDESKTIISAYEFDAQMTTDLNEQFDLLVLQVQNMLPFMLITIGVFASVLNHWALVKGLKRFKFEVQETGLFRDFQLPRNVFLGSMIMMVLAWLTGILGLSNSDILFLNILLVVVFVFSIQGAAVSIFFMYHYKFPRSAVVAFTTMGILFYSMLQFPLFVLGMLETIINLRARMKSNT